jgi:uncharacterized protein Usg
LSERRFGDTLLRPASMVVSNPDGAMNGVSQDFRSQIVEGYGLTTADILYRMPDHPGLLQSYLWQQYDLFPRFPALARFLEFWERELDGPLFSVKVAHKRLLAPTDWRAISELRLH